MKNMQGDLPQFAIIVAIAHDNAIGRNNQLLFRISNDMRHFRTTTLANTVIMGRNTFLSLGAKPLPDRQNIILSRNPNLALPLPAQLALSLPQALSMALPKRRIFIIGGEQLYQQALPYASSLILTRIDAPATPPADAFFPEIDPTHWILDHCTPWLRMNKSAHPYRTEYYTRKTIQ